MYGFHIDRQKGLWSRAIPPCSMSYYLTQATKTKHCTCLKVVARMTVSRSGTGEAIWTKKIKTTYSRLPSSTKYVLQKQRSVLRRGHAPTPSLQILHFFSLEHAKIIYFSIASPYNFLDSGVCWLQAIKTINVLAIFFHNNNTSN